MTLKEKVINRSYMTGTHVHLLDASVTEMLSYLGYDFIWLDMEHTQLSCEDAYHHLMAAKAGGTPRWGTFFSSWLVHEIFETFDLPANFSAFDSTSAPHFLEFFPTSF